MTRYGEEEDGSNLVEGWLRFLLLYFVINSVHALKRSSSDVEEQKRISTVKVFLSRLTNHRLIA